MNSKPLVSAIVSMYKSERFIRSKIEDLLSQSIIKKLEIILVNSGSPQNEENIVKEYLVHHENFVYLKTEERETVYKAWNRGIKMSSGKFITNSNTDDRLRKDAYEILSDYLEKNPDVALVYADQYLCKIENQNFNQVMHGNIIRFPDYTHLKQLDRCIVGSQPMWRSSLHFNDNFWFNEKYEVSGDHEFELRISEKYKIQHISIALGTFYKSQLNENKESENPLITKSEVNEVLENSIRNYLNTRNVAQLKSLKNEFRYFLMLPILIFELLKRIDRLIFPRIYSKFFFHSIEFIYYFNILICLKLGEIEQGLKLCKKFLFFKKSVRIKKIQFQLNAARNSIE